MKNKILKYLFIIFSLIQFTNCKAQTKSVCSEIFPYVSSQILTGDTIISVTRDDIRLRNTDKFYSIFYIINRDIHDSLSLDTYSNSGAKPKDLFFWKTKNGEKFVCLEYYEGSGIGHINIDETKLLLFDLSNDKLSLIGSFGTDSAYNDSWKNYYFNITSRIFQNEDTLYIARRGWNNTVLKNKEIKINNYNRLTEVIWNSGKMEISITKEPPYFYYKGW